MNAKRSGKLVILAVILFLAVAIIYSSFSTSAVFATYPRTGWYGSKECTGSASEAGGKTCCWSESSGIDSIVERYCQTCREPPILYECDEPVKQKTIRGGDFMNPLGAGGPEIAPPTEPEVDCTTNPTHPSCQPTELAPQVDCAQNPDDPLCETAIAPETAPTELAPQVDCAQNPDDPLCETATIPEAGGEENGGEDTEQQQPQVEEEEPQPEEDQSSDENNDN